MHGHGIVLFAQLISKDSQKHYTVNYVKAMVLNLWVADPKLGRLKIPLDFFGKHLQKVKLAVR